LRNRQARARYARATCSASRTKNLPELVRPLFEGALTVSYVRTTTKPSVCTQEVRPR
jgi:hypothetical protein